MQATMARTAFARLHGPRALAWGRGVAHVRSLSGGPDGYWFSEQRRTCSSRRCSPPLNGSCRRPRADDARRADAPAHVPVVIRPDHDFRHPRPGARDSCGPGRGAAGVVSCTTGQNAVAALTSLVASGAVRRFARPGVGIGDVHVRVVPDRELA